MRYRFTVWLVFVLINVAIASSAHAQGSWLPFGASGASDIAVSPSGVVWLVGREAGSIRSTLVLGETRFFTPPGSPAHVAVDLNGFPWLLNADGALWHFVRRDGKEDWARVSMKAIDIAVGASGAVWAIDSDHHVVKHVNGEPEKVGGYGVKIAVDPAGNPWIVDAAGDVSQLVGNTWKKIPARATDIAIAPDGAVFILGSTPVRGGFEVLRLNGSSWERIVGGAGIAISAGSKAVYVAQDPATNLVLTSSITSLRVAEANASVDPSTSQSPTATAGSRANEAAPAATSASASASVAGTVDSARTGPSRSIDATKDEKGSSLPIPSAGAVVGAAGAVAGAAGSVAGALGSLGGLLSKGAAVVPTPPTPGSVATAVGAAAAGAVASTAVGAAGNVAGSAIGSVMPGGGAPTPTSASSAAQTSQSTQPQNSSTTESSPANANAPRASGVSAPRPSFKLPLPGNLRCPIIGGGAAMERGCELLGRAALKLRQAPSADCPAPAFADSRNGGECWTCPATFTRSSAPIDTDGACLGPASERSVATLVKGCATYKTPPGYGTPFRDSPNGSECWVCPLPLKRSWSTVANLTKGNLAACFGKAKELLVWQLGQYPEVGTYRLMPGLLSIALSDPKAVDAFLDTRANGDTAAKRAMWASMLSDPSSSAELKALLFASLLTVAKQDSASPAAKEAVHEFEAYIQARRKYVAEEALRMYRKAREVDEHYRHAIDSGGIARAAGDAVAASETDFKTYAWSSVVPDSAGTAFIIASAALAKIGVSGGIEGAVDAGISSFNVRYLAPVTKALEDEIDALQDKGETLIEKVRTASAVSSVAKNAMALKSADPAMIGSTLLSGAVKISNGVLSFFGKDKIASEYEKYVDQMSVPVRVSQMLDSDKPEDRQSLLLYWALATSAHKATEQLGTGAMTGAELCSDDSWTAAQCSAAKTMIEAAAKAAGYVN